MERIEQRDERQESGMSDPQFTSNTPPLFRLAKTMLRRRIKGGGFIMRRLEKRALKNRIVRYNYAPGYDIYVPIYRREHWDRTDIVAYEEKFLGRLTSTLAAIGGPFTMADCGADIGIISVGLAARSKQIERIIAFEPSGEAFAALEKTFKGLPVKATALNEAVSDFVGLGALATPEYDVSNFARYLVRSQTGFPVRTIDSLDLNAQRLVIKIDVEGGEIGVIRGARSSIKKADHCVVTIEAHPRVFDRTGIDPITVMGELNSIRPFSFLSSETGKKDFDLARPFFSQQPKNTAIYNVICVSSLVH